MVPTSQKIHRLTDEGPKADGARYFHPGEEKAPEGPRCIIPALHGQLQRGWRLSPAAAGEVSS